MEEISKLEKEFEAAEAEYSKVFSLSIDGVSIEEYMARLEPYREKCQEIDRKIRMLKNPIFEPIPDYGDVMSLETFIECCKSGGFIDYDGSGNYAKDGQMSDISIHPSDVDVNMIRKDFDTVVWFNR